MVTIIKNNKKKHSVRILMAYAKTTKLFASPVARAIFLENGFSAIGDGFYYIVFLSFAQSLPDAALIITVLTVAKKLPFALGVILGMISDKIRYRPRYMIISNVLRGILFLAIAVLLFTTTMHYILLIFLIVIALDVACDTIGAISTKFYSAFIKYSVHSDNLAHAQGSLNGLNQAISLFSSAIGALLVSLLTAVDLALFNGFIFFVCASIIIIFRKPLQSIESEYIRPHISDVKVFSKDSIKTALQYFGRPDFRHILIFMLSAGAVTETVIPQAILMLSTRDTYPVLNFQTSVFAIMLTFSIGMIFGATFLTQKLSKLSFLKIIPIAQACVLGTYMCLLFENFYLFYVAVFTMACVLGLLNAKLFAHYIKHIPTGVIATFFGIVSTLTFILVMISISVFNVLSIMCSFSLSLAILISIWVVCSLLQLFLYPQSSIWAKINSQTTTFITDNKRIVFNPDTDAMIELPKSIFASNKVMQNHEVKELFESSGVFADTREVVKENYDEAQTDTLQLALLVHENCNFRCVYCYEKFEKGLLNADIAEGVIKFAKHELAKNNYNQLSIGWFGGEPLLAAEEITQLTKRFKEICGEQGVEYVSNITTNGYLLDTKVQKTMLQNGITNFQITVDGDKEYHDKQRVLTNGTGTFDKIWNNLKKWRNDT